MTETTVNIPLLRKAVEWAEAEAAKPHELCEWVQEFWMLPVGGAYRAEYEKDDQACGTCYCIAGFVASQVGEINHPEGEDAPGIAAEALGIDWSGGLTPGHLFYARNTIEDVRRIAESIAGERL